MSTFEFQSWRIIFFSSTFIEYLQFSVHEHLPQIGTVLKYAKLLPSWSVCLEAGDRQVLTTRATARSLGELNITVEAKIANIEAGTTRQLKTLKNKTFRFPTTAIFLFKKDK